MIFLTIALGGFSRYFCSYPSALSHYWFSVGFRARCICDSEMRILSVHNKGRMGMRECRTNLGGEQLRASVKVYIFSFKANSVFHSNKCRYVPN